MSTEPDLDRAAAAIERGELVVYPTETVYGLGADALDPDAVERVYEVKGRDRSNPISLGVPDVEAATRYVEATDRELAFMREFLPGPVTVVCRRRSVVPDVLTAGRDRVGVRVPDHDLALALLERAGPITATSANRSGTGSVRRLDDLSDSVREAVAVRLDDGDRSPSVEDGADGESATSESTVVDVSAGTIHRRGALADEIDAWLAE